MECLLPCSFKAFSPDWQSLNVRGCRSAPCSARHVTKNNGDRDNAWEELPVAALFGKLPRGPSTPRHGFSWEQRFWRRSGRDDSWID